MTSIVLLFAWMALGLLAAAVWSRPGESAIAWAPLAILFGPLWALIATERQWSVVEAGLPSCTCAAVIAAPGSAREPAGQ